MHRPARRLTIAAAAAALALSAVAGPSLATDQWVTMFGFEFRPSSVAINVGDTVTWVNDDEAPHDASGDGWSTELLAMGQSDAVTFDAAGTYSYICSIHPEMTGTVTVREASGGNGGGGGGGAGPDMTDPPTDTVAPDVEPDATTVVSVGGAAALGFVLLTGALAIRRSRSGR